MANTRITENIKGGNRCPGVVNVVEYLHQVNQSHPPWALYPQTDRALRSQNHFISYRDNYTKITTCMKQHSI